MHVQSLRNQQLILKEQTLRGEKGKPLIVFGRFETLSVPILLQGPLMDWSTNSLVSGVSGGVIYGETCALLGVCESVAPHYLPSPITGWIYGHHREAVKAPKQGS